MRPLAPHACALWLLLIAGPALPDSRPVSFPDSLPEEPNPTPPAQASGQDLTPAQGPSLRGEGAALDARSHAALERGLAYLARSQATQHDGTFPRAGGEKYVPVPVTALAALAFMSAGSQPDRGPFGREVALAIDYLTARADMNPGSKTYGYLASEGDELSRLHGHGFAALALSQAYAISPRTTRGHRIEEVLRASIALIEGSQGLEGGWFYEPRRSTDHENSVTVVLVQALRAARNSGIRVDVDVIARAVDYIRRCQAEDGSFKYGLDTEKTTVALTAAGIATLNAAGMYDGPEVTRAMEVLWQRLGLREHKLRGSASRFQYYERFYLAQALWQHPDQRLFESWAIGERERVLAEQRQDGSWEDSQFGGGYATAMNCLFLSMPEGLLPIFQR